MAGRFLSVFTAIFVFSFSLQVQAVEFRGAEYDVYLGDVNGDGIDDIYLKVPDIFVLLHGDISVPLLIDSELPSYLVESVNGVYQYYSSPTIDESIDIQGLTLSNGIASLSDQNFDGIHDLHFSGGGLLYSFSIDGDVLQPVNVVYTEYQTPSISTAAVDPVNDPLEGNRYLGALRGSYEVGQNGVFKYRVPIEVPPGINGVQPKVGLGYTSSGSNGVMGWGWSITGVSKIHRCKKSLIRDGELGGVTDEDDFRYCLDGRRLIEVSENEFRLEDENFSKIVATMGTKYPVRWDVFPKTGGKIVYGDEDNSRIDGKLLDIIPESPNPDLGDDESVSYYIDKLQDVHGNWVDYKYSVNYQDNTHKLSSIEYTKTNDGSEGLNNEIKFLYNSRPDPIVSFKYGHKIQILERLSTIEIHVNGSLFNSYQLEYQESGESYFGDIYSDPVGTSKLFSVTRCFSGENCQSPVLFDWSDSDESSTNLMDFQLCENAKYDYAFPGIPVEEFASQYAVPIDLDGDSNNELIYMGNCATKDPIYTLDATTSYFPVPEEGYCFFLVDENSTQLQNVTEGIDFLSDVELTYRADSLVKLVGYTFDLDHNVYEMPRVLDLNSDGLEDVIISSEDFVTGIRAYISDGDQLVESPEYSFPISTSQDSYLSYRVESRDVGDHTFTAHLNYGIKFIDLNGDGLVDLLRSPPVTPSSEWVSISELGDPNISVSLNTGNGFGEFSAWADLTSYEDYNWVGLSNPSTALTPFLDPKFEDVNGDGLPDLVGHKGEVGINTGNGFLRTTSWKPIIGEGNGNGTYDALTTRFGDVNGDGLVDLVAVRSDGVYVSFSDGSRFLDANLWSSEIKTNDFWRVVLDFYSGGTGEIVDFFPFDPNISQSPFSAFQLIDVNKDGRSDIVFTFRAFIPEGELSENTYRNEDVELHLSNGVDEFLPPKIMQFPSVNVDFADIIDQDVFNDLFTLPEEINDFWMPLNGIPHFTEDGNVCYQRSRSMHIKGDDGGLIPSIFVLQNTEQSLPTVNRTDKFKVNGQDVILPGRKGFSAQIVSNQIDVVVEEGRSVSVSMDLVARDSDFYTQDQSQLSNNISVIDLNDYGIERSLLTSSKRPNVKDSFLFADSNRKVVTQINEIFYNEEKTVKYEYGNYGQHLSGYGGLGFGFVKEVSIKPGADFVQEKYYSHIVGDGYQLSRKLLASKSYAVIPSVAEDGEPTTHLLREVENRWKVRTYSDDHDGGKVGQHAICKTGSITCPFISNGESPHYFSYLYESMSKSWDLDGSKIGDRLKAVYEPESKTCELSSSNVVTVTKNGSSEDIEFDEYGTPLVSSTVSCSHENSTAAVVANVINNTNVTAIDNADVFVAGLVGTRINTAYVGASSTTLDQSSRSETFTYTGKGQIRSKTVVGTLDEQKTTTYSYNSYGSVSQITENWENSENNGLDFTTRTSSIVETIDAQGNRKVELTNPLNSKRTTVYDPRYGNKTTETDENGLTQNSYYDELGRLTGSDYADGTTSQIDYRICSNCFDDFNSTAKYYIQEKRTGQSAVREYYDVFDQSVGARTKNFDGSFVYKVNEYDNLRRLSKEFLPRFESGAESNITYLYDVLNRNIETLFSDGTKKTVVYSGLTQIITNQLDQIKTVTDNASGWLVASMDDSAVSVEFSYWPFGELKSTKVNDDNLTIVNLGYDSLGRQTLLDDPNTGAITYRHNPLGQVAELSNAVGQVTRFGYDQLGRQILRVDDATENNPESRTHRWYYDEVPNGVGLPSSVVGYDTDGVVFSKEYDYNEYSFPVETLTTIDGREYLFKNYYDNYSRPLATQYPTGYTVVNRYNDYGFRSGVRDTAANYDVWSASEMNIWGTISLSELGNGLSLSVDNDPVSGRVSAISVSDGALKVVDQQYEFDALGNLKKRTDLVHSVTQNLCYDNMNRLKSSRIDEVCDTHTDNTFDDLGNIKSKKGVSGIFSYGKNGAGPHAVTAANGLVYSYDQNGNMTSAKSGNNVVRSVSYSAFDKPTIIENDGNTTRLVYGPNQDRIKRIDSNGRATVYVGSGIYEENNDNGLIEKVHYIDDIALYISESGPQDGFYSYLHRDHIGTVVAKTGENVNDVEYLSNDSWGRRVSDTWIGSPVENGYVPSDTSRGFTNHEHLDQVGLIHMNGRVYDPVLGRFLSPDPLVQTPDNTQSYNRYSYVFNNPLSLVDPTGFETEETFVFGRRNEPVSYCPCMIGPILHQIYDRHIVTPLSDGLHHVLDNDSDVISTSSGSDDAGSEDVNEDGSGLGAEISDEELRQRAIDALDRLTASVPASSTGGSPGDFDPEEPRKKFNKKGGGKNSKHANADKRAQAEKKWNESKNKMSEAKRNGASRKEKLKIQKEIDHWKRKMDFSGENHSMKPK